MPTPPAAEEHPLSRRSVIRLGAGLAAAGVTATAITGVFRGISTRGPAAASPDPSGTGTAFDHAYTTDPDERAALIAQGYRDLTGCSGFLYVFTERVVSSEVTVSRLHRLYHSSWRDHAYTPYPAEYQAFLDQGYQDESDRDPMWVLMLDDATQAPPRAGRLYRVFNPDVIDNYYTTSAVEAERAVRREGYRPEWPDPPFPFVFGTPAVANGAATARLYQLCQPDGETPLACRPA